jgi:hypothetical protein
MNIYLAYAEQAITQPVKCRMHAAELRATTHAQRAQEKALQERDELFARWKKQHKAQQAVFLAGPHHTEAAKLVAFLDTLTLDDGEALLACLRAGPGATPITTPASRSCN